MKVSLSNCKANNTLSAKIPSHQKSHRRPKCQKNLQLTRRNMNGQWWKQSKTNFISWSYQQIACKSMPWYLSTVAGAVTLRISRRTGQSSVDHVIAKFGSTVILLQYWLKLKYTICHLRWSPKNISRNQIKHSVQPVTVTGLDDSRLVINTVQPSSALLHYFTLKQVSNYNIFFSLYVQRS